MSSSKTIVFIHGAWVTAACWDPFVDFFTKQGYTCLAPHWPGKAAPIKEQQKHPEQILAGLGVQDIVDHYEKIIRALPEPPILIGHSYGGLFVQMLLDRGVGACGIAIDSAPPKGLLAWAYPSIVRAFYRILFTPGGWKKIVRIRPHDFAYGFVHLLPKSTQQNIYDQYVVPETGRIFFQSAFSMFNHATQVNFNNTQRAPLLLIAGEHDKVTPAGLNVSNYKKYNKAVQTDYKLFTNRTHWLIADTGWEEIAQYIQQWLTR